MLFRSPFVDKGKKVLFVPGNHDGFALGDFLADFYNIKNLHGTSASYYQIGFFGCGGANVGLDALSDEETFDTLKKGFSALKETQTKIMITHVHPDGTIVDKMFPRWGSKGVRKAIETFKPDILLCGHVHEAEGVEDIVGNTRVLNVGRKGKILEIPLV